MEAVERKREAVEREIARLGGLRVTPDRATSARLRETGREPPRKAVSAVELLRRPDVDYGVLGDLGVSDDNLGETEREQVEILAKYASYIEKQGREVERIRRLEDWPIPVDFDYAPLTGLKREAAEKLARFRPATVGQASRIMGVTQADLAVLLVHLERARGAVSATPPQVGTPG